MVRVYRDDPQAPHEIVDHLGSVALSGDFADTHLTGDNATVLTTDATKNTVYGFAKGHGEQARTPEGFGIAPADHVVDTIEHVTSARVQWCHDDAAVSNPHTDRDTSFAAVLDAMTRAFAESYSYALQHTVWEMGQAW